MKPSICAAAAVVWADALPIGARSQQPSEWGTEPRENTPRWHALTGVTRVAAPGRVAADATVVLRDGQIVTTAAGAVVPAGARVWPLPGWRVYAVLIDMAASVGVPTKHASCANSASPLRWRRLRPASGAARVRCSRSARWRQRKPARKC